FVEVQSWNAGVRRRTGSKTVGHVENVIPHPAETELVDERGARGKCPTERQALVQSLGISRVVAECGSARHQTEGSRRLLGEGGITIPAEKRMLLIQVVIPARVPLISGDRHGAVHGVVVNERSAGNLLKIRQRKILQNVLCLRA